jgi:arylsulfatase A-like enzyme
MISVDDMKPWIGPYGFTAAHTPALDAFATRGLVFQRAYCAAPACAPSRTAVFTGLAPHQTGCYLNRHNWREIFPEVTSFPRLLRQSGYFTAGYGKLSHTARQDEPDAWDERHYLKLIKMPKGAPLNVPKSIWRKSGSRFDWAPLDRPVEEMDDHLQVDRAIAAMKRPGDRPWFVACGIFRPHLPWYVPRRFFDLHPLDSVSLPEMIPGDLDDVPLRGRSFAKQREHSVIVSNNLWRPAVQAYMASISYADYEIGRLLAETPADTTIVLWSDHGWHLGPKNHWHKYSLWEEASQTVMAMAGPGVSAGEKCFRTVSLNDIYPTLCELCGLSPPHELAGRSLLPLTRDPAAKWDRPALTTYGANNHSIRSERYRYIRYDDGSHELYDHNVDPHEWNNIAGTANAGPIIATHAALLPEGTPKKRKRLSRRKRPWLGLKDGRRVLRPR